MQNEKGFVRRLDELGRVVIPKELRHSLKIENGNLLEFFYTSQGLKISKYEPVRELGDFGSKMLYSLRGYTDFGLLLCDTQRVVCVQNFSKKDTMGKRLTLQVLAQLKQAGESFEAKAPLDVKLNENNLVFPIKVLGDLFGCLIVTTKNSNFDEVFVAAKTVVQILCDYLDE